MDKIQIEEIIGKLIEFYIMNSNQEVEVTINPNYLVDINQNIVSCKVICEINEVENEVIG